MKNEEIKSIENLKNKKDTYVIRWQVTSVCNYHCDFCVQGNRKVHAQNSKGESSEVRQKICNQLVKFIENELNGRYALLRIFLIGGEVTALKDFSKILKQLANVNFDGDIRIQITTNLSASKEELLDIVNIFNGLRHKKYLRLLNMSTSFYKEFTTEEEFMEKIKIIRNPHPNINKFVRGQIRYRKKGIRNKVIFKIAKMLEKKNRNIFLNIGYPLVDDQDYSAYLEFQNRNLKYVDEINYIVIRNYKKEISDILKEKLNNNRRREIKLTKLNGEVLFFRKQSDISLTMEGGFNPEGMICDAGVHNISINNLGMVSRCVSCVKESALGDITKQDFHLIEKRFSCPMKSCFCNYYRLIEKRK